MNGRAILTVIRKDLKVVSQNKGVIVPIIIVIVVAHRLRPFTRIHAAANCRNCR